MNIFGKSVPFYKMQGCGNDFVVIDNREIGVPESVMDMWAQKICSRAFGVYADGLFFLENSDDPALDYRWHFYNSDGSRAEMCGNASRCAGKLAHAIELAPAEHTFGTDAGPIKAQVLLEGPNRGRVKVQLTPPVGTETNIKIDIDNQPMTIHFADTGVPHVVVFVDDIEALDIMDLGPKIRYHDHFAPAGTNVNFAQVKDENTMLLRTYERGVEAETYACGTGAAAAQLIANKLGLTDDYADLTTTGNEVLTIFLEDGNIFLQGAAELTFKGDLFLEPLDLKADGIPSLTQDCVGCGWCCLTDPCMDSHRKYGYMRRCPDLFWDEDKSRYMCAMMLDPEIGEQVKKSQHAGQGCYAPRNSWREDVRNRDDDK